MHLQFIILNTVILLFPWIPQWLNFISNMSDNMFKQIKIEITLPKVWKRNRKNWNFCDDALKIEDYLSPEENITGVP